MYKQAIRLRRRSKSYSHIHNVLNIPKSTLSSWFSNEVWSSKIKNKLIIEKKDYWKISLKYARTANIKRGIERHFRYVEEANRLYTSLKKNPLFLVGLTAYWGEGNKASGNVVSIANTDPLLVRVVENFYTECLKIPINKLRVGLFLYRDIQEDKAKKFWSSLLYIPDNQFIKTQFLRSKSVLTKRKSKNGICSLYFSSTELSIKIQEWIKLLSLDYSRV